MDKSLSSPTIKRIIIIIYYYYYLVGKTSQKSKFAKIKELNPLATKIEEFEIQIPIFTYK